MHITDVKTRQDSAQWIMGRLPESLWLCFPCDLNQDAGPTDWVKELSATVFDDRDVARVVISTGAFDNFIAHRGADIKTAEFALVINTEDDSWAVAIVCNGAADGCFIREPESLKALAEWTTMTFAMTR